MRKKQAQPKTKRNCGPKTSNIFQENVNYNYPEFRSASEVQVPASGDQVSASGDQVSASGDQVSASGDQVPASGDQVPASEVQAPASEASAASTASKPAALNPTGDELIAEALKAANMTELLPAPQPRKLRQPRKPRVLRPLLKTAQPCNQCKIIIYDERANHKLVYDRLYVKCQIRVDDLTEQLCHVTREKEHYKSLCLVLAEKMLETARERDHYKSLCGHNA